MTREELKQIFVEIMLGSTSKVTKVADHSVLNGVSYGVAAIGQKAMKDIAITETLINPDMAYGVYLDRLAANWGISNRFAESGSSVFVRLVAVPGTIYPAGSEISGDQGIQFSIVGGNDLTHTNYIIPDDGFVYAKANSVQTGSQANVNPISLTRVDPSPVGHLYLINEYIAVGGRNQESDEHFRTRIKEGVNIVANGTLSKFEQIFMRENSDILRLYHGGVSENGQNILRVATVNGRDLTPIEFSDLVVASADYLPLSDIRIYQGIVTYGLKLENVVYYPLDISFRVDLSAGYDSDDVRKNMQLNVAKLFDYRFYNNTGVIDWDDIFYVVKNTAGVEYLADQSFLPGSDIYIPKDSLPRVRGFEMYDLSGVLISDGGGNLDPIYYPNSLSAPTQTNI